jgi:hypothetical protein
MNKTKIIENAVAALQEWGYPNCNAENIFTDPIYSRFFKRQIEQTLCESSPDEVRDCLNNILSQINSNSL